MNKVKSNTWIIFTLTGFIFTFWGIHQLFIIPTFPADHWDWLVPTPDLIEYIKFRFQNIGVFTLANGLFILGVSLTGFRRDEQWVWVALTVVAVYLLLLTAVFPWLFFIFIPLGLLAGWALWVSKPSFEPAQESGRGFGWMLVFLTGLLLLYFAYDNLFAIPALDVHDPERGWDWLTTNPEHIDYIKLYFRVYGIHVAAFSAMTLLAAFVGLREGFRSAWKVLWFVPLLIILHVFFWPWLSPLLIAIALLAAGGLWLAKPKKI